MTVEALQGTTPSVNLKPFSRAGVADVAHHFGVTERTVFNWMAQRVIPFYKISGKVRFDLEQVDKHVREKCLIHPK